MLNITVETFLPLKYEQYILKPVMRVLPCDKLNLWITKGDMVPGSTQICISSTTDAKPDHVLKDPVCLDVLVGSSVGKESAGMQKTAYNAGALVLSLS